MVPATRLSLLRYQTHQTLFTTNQIQMAKPNHCATLCVIELEETIALSIRQHPEELHSMARMGFIFALLLYFSICGLFAVQLGYDLFHTGNPSGLLAIFFLVFSGGALFLFMHLISAVTGPLPTWYTYFVPPLPQPETTSVKKQVFIVYAGIYVTIIASALVTITGRFSLEQIAWPVAIGILSFLLLSWLLSMLAAVLSISKKDGKTSSFGDKAS